MKTEFTPSVTAPAATSDIAWLRKKHACDEGRIAVENAGGLVEFWKTTGRGDWMLWLDIRLNILTATERKAFADRCANAALDACEPLRPKLKDPRSVLVLDVARAFLADAASCAELVSAREAEADARRELWRSWSAAAAAAYDAARADRRKQQADWLREIVSAERFAEALEKMKQAA